MAITGLHIPLIYSERNDPNRVNQRKVDKIYRKIVEHRADEFVFQTTGAQKCYPKKVQKRSVVILNPLDVTGFPTHDFTVEKKEIVTVGRLEPQKNQKLLINAFSELAKDFPDYTLIIYGEGSLRNELENYIISKGLQSKVVLPGVKNNIQEYIKDASLFVLSSDYEGIPNALIEAMAIGLPCVSTDCSPGGARELIADEAGRISQITYLDADGNPAPTSAGYTILKRIYHRDGTAETDKYFDADGNPMALAKGQYGIKRSGKVNLLLDKNGNIMLCVDNILNGFPATVVVSGVIICVLMLLFPRKASIALTAAYMVFILYETLMFRETGDARTNFVLFSYADRFFTEQSVRVGVINNIWLFIPLGTGLYRNIQKRWGLLIPLLLSIAIETTQYITGLGIAEFDDVFGNTVGGWIGIASAYAAVRWNFETHIHDVAKRLERE